METLIIGAIGGLANSILGLVQQGQAKKMLEGQMEYDSRAKFDLSMFDTERDYTTYYIVFALIVVLIVALIVKF